MSRPASVTIHSAALQHNLSIAQQAAPHSKVMPAIKANAYGHGMIQTADALYDSAAGFIVACLSEALQLRAANIKKTLLVIQGCQNLEAMKIAVEKNIRVVIHTETQLQLLDNLPSLMPIKVALKLDTGMSRLGFPASNATHLYRKLTQHSQVHPDIWLMTHLANADDLSNEHTTQQVATFDRYTRSIQTTKTIANSAGILGWPNTHRDWIRPGIMIYGSSPFALNVRNKSRQQLNLKAAMTLTAPLIAINNLHKGDAIGYGSTWVCPQDMQVGVVACGYADGYPRHASQDTPIWINGKRTHILGRVSMDLIVIDLTHIPATVGNLAECWGEHVSIDEVASLAETISYELLCHAGANSQANYS